MNTIFIHDMRLDTKVGVYAWERELPQTLRLDLEIELPSSRPFETGELADALDQVARRQARGAARRARARRGHRETRGSRRLTCAGPEDEIQGLLRGARRRADGERRC